MQLTSTQSADVFLHVPREASTYNTGPWRGAGGRAQGKPTTTVTLVFFIPGNPGLISYYHPFLDLLVKRIEKHQQQDRRKDGQIVVVAGLSLGGFEVGRNGRDDDDDDDDNDNNKINDESAKKKTIRELMYPSGGSYGGIDGDDNDRIYSLKDQIELCYVRVQSLCGMIREEYHGQLDEDEKDCVRPDMKVILVGHSVGTYTGLEMVRLWHGRELPSRPQHNSPNLEREQEKEPTWKISNCILLTPTIVDLHNSASGRIATPLLTGIPVVSGYVPGLAHLLVQGVLIKIVPAPWLRGIVKNITGMKEGDHGLDSTMAFLNSHKGVKQALTMAADELREIRADRWGEEVWGAAVDEEEGDATTSTTPTDENERNEGTKTNKNPPPGMYLWFAKEDHWVADMTRTDILKNRGQTEASQQRGPTIVIDETEGLVHAWCLEQSEMVAEKVGRWLEGIMA